LRSARAAMVDAAGAGGDAGESVVVVTHVRPLVDSEIEEGAAECLTVTGSAAEVRSGGAQGGGDGAAPAPHRAAPRGPPNCRATRRRRRSRRRPGASSHFTSNF
jgi:hypothetical protein